MKYRWMILILCLAALVATWILARGSDEHEKKEALAAPAPSIAAADPSSSGMPMLLPVSKAPDWLHSYLEPKYKVNVIKDISYANKKNETEAVEPLNLDLYSAVNEDEKQKPVFVFIHGGGYREGSKEDAAFFSTELAKRGYIAVSMNYRLKKEPDADFERTLNDAYEDIADVLSWIRTHSDAYGMDADRVALGGDSAGGHLALNYVNRSLAEDPASSASIFAILDLYGGEMDASVHGKLPSVLIVHGTNDKLIPYDQSVQLNRELQRAGVYSDFFTMEGAGHDYKNDRYKQEVIDTASSFLQNVIGRKDMAALPEESSFSAVSGDPFELKLPSAMAALPIDSSRMTVYLPENWTITRKDSNSLMVSFPPGLSRGSHSIFVAAAGEESEIGYTVNVNVIDPLSESYETYYDGTDGTVKTKVTVTNASDSPFKGTLRVRYTDPEGRDQSYERTETQDEPNATEAFTIADPLSGDIALEAHDESGRLIQQSVKKKSVLLIHEASGPIRIDGSLKEWQDASRFEASTVRDNTWKGPDDLSANGYMSWDEENLYLAVEATDDTHAQPAFGGDIWSGDSVQFAVGIVSEDGAVPSTYSEMGYALGDDSQIYKWRWLAPLGLAVGDYLDTDEAIESHDGKTVYEIAIPWEELGADQGGEGQGLQLKISLLVNDNDANGREGWIEYNGGIGTAKDILEFGDVFLVP